MGNYDLLNKIKDFDYGDSYNDIGLLFFDELNNYYEGVTPKNSKSFANTGGEFVHFSFLEVNGEYSENNPVIMTTPSGDIKNIIVGENLYDFLSLGFEYGFFGLERLKHNPTDVIKNIEDGIYFDIEAIEDYEDEDSEEVVDLLEKFGKEFKLKRWGKGIKDRLLKLNEKYFPLLKGDLGNDLISIKELLNNG